MKRGYWTLLLCLCGLAVALISPAASARSPYDSNNDHPQGPYRIRPVHVSTSPAIQRYRPLGLNWQTQISPHWDMALLLEYEWFAFSPGMSLDPIQSKRLQAMTSSKAEGHGLLAAIQFIGRYLEQDFVIQPYYRLWDAQGFGSGHSHSMMNHYRSRDLGQEIREFGIHLTWRF